MACIGTTPCNPWAHIGVTVVLPVCVTLTYTHTHVTSRACKETSIHMQLANPQVQAPPCPPNPQDDAVWKRYVSVREKAEATAPGPEDCANDESYIDPAGVRDYVDCVLEGFKQLTKAVRRSLGSPKAAWPGAALNAAASRLVLNCSYTPMHEQAARQLNPSCYAEASQVAAAAGR